MRLVLPVVLLLAGTRLALADPTAEMLTGSCANCHGPDSTGAGIIPGLKGRPEAELLEKLKGFKTGALPSTIMGRLANGYSDTQLAVLARYFAASR
jgi:cytochrome c553